MVKRQRTRSAQTKFDAVIELLTGAKSADAISVERGIARRSLYRWRQQLLEEGPAIFERDEEGAKAAEARVAELEQMVGRLTMEVGVLKKASVLLSSRPKKDER
jgi:transposase